MAAPKMIKKGFWEQRFKYKDPITNKWRDKYISGKTKKEVEEKYDNFKSSLNSGIGGKDFKLLDFFDSWVETFKSNVSTGRKQKMTLVRKNLEDFFGDEQTIRGVTKLTYQKFVNWLGTPAATSRKKGGKILSKETITNRHNIVKSMFLEAIDMQIITANPTRNIKISGDEEPEHKSNLTISLEDTEKFKNELLSRADSVSKFFILTQLYTGCRYQEAAALTWDDLDQENGIIHITKAFKYDGGEKRIGPTKSKAGVRSVDVPSSLFQELRRYKLHQKELMIAGRLINPKNFVFCNDRDTWPISNSVVNKMIRMVCESAGIPRISSHSLRHGKIDALILADADLIYIKDQVGHRQISQSWEYASASNESREKNKKKLESIWGQIG